MTDTTAGTTADRARVFTHEQEAELCRRLLGDRAHGLETLVARTR
ncbi:hypothetical protein [Actinomycetospora lemnae]|uniref:Transposase n=1 Tax=Actinomycetospora lemnae TaxID=3019891 RepID=A0ABT5SV16_9PSEU|nr:hypothetical protein [Actinomycetospora sp. DW7H6]MDD7965583.1 hypothetical protein [Actinomycetospora sp. DW7H6]